MYVIPFKPFTGFDQVQRTPLEFTHTYTEKSIGKRDEEKYIGGMKGTI